MKRTTLFLGGLLCFATSHMAFAQAELKIINQIETRFNEVNDSGMGVTVSGFYDFATETLTPYEQNVFSVESINNDNNVFAFGVDEDFNMMGLYRIDDVWREIGFLEGQNPDTDDFTPSKISGNSKYLTGQTNVGSVYGGFIFDTETEELTAAFDPEGESGAFYSINNSGIAVGWIDRPDNAGTMRVPAYRDAEGDFHFIPTGQLPTLTGINTISDINNSNVMVGDFDNHPFIYEMATDNFRSLSLPEGADAGAFASISEDGVAVGYADVDWQIRDAIIYHPSLGDNPIYITELLSDLGIELNTPDGMLGTAIGISPNGNYIVGWLNGPPMYAEGWMLYLDDLFLDTPTHAFTKLSVHPNPVQDVLTFSNTEKVENVEVYSVPGQKVSGINWNPSEVDLSSLSKGIYMVKVIANGQSNTFKIIKE